MRKCLSLRGLLVARIRLDQRKSVRPFKGIFWDDISEFESYMPSQPVRSLWRFAEGHLGPSRPRKIGQLANDARVLTRAVTLPRGRREADGAPVES
jgi:hypothetical protein